MTRQHRRREHPSERLARALRDAYIDALVAVNTDSLRPRHPCWEEVGEMAKQGWRAVALCLMRRGVQPPKE